MIELTRIGGLTDSGLPHLRLVWGQAKGLLASTYEFNGEVHLTYRHHVKKTQMYALPVRDLSGKIVDYDVFDSVDVIPADGRVIGAFTMKEDIGIPRWFIESATAVDPIEWEYQRQMALARNEMDPGACPAGGVVYEEMYCVAYHNACCDREGLTPQRKVCRGEYREPSDLDLFVLRGIEERMRATKGWTGNAGWRAPVVAEEVAKAVIAHHASDAKDDARERDEVQYLMASQFRPHAKRAVLTLTGTGHGMDLEKYHSVPTTYKRIKKQRGQHATVNADV